MTTSRIALLLAIAGLAACGGSRVNPSVSSSTVSVEIRPASAYLSAGGTASFAATVTGTTVDAVTWKVGEVSGGAIDASGVYSAPSSTGAFHVVATSVADPSVSATATVTVSALSALPPLHIDGGALLDPHGNRVMLRGVSSQGMAQVYGDKANPGTYLPMSPAEYVSRALQTDGTGNRWYSTAIRLVFERYPCVNPARLYTQEGVPYAMPDVISFPAWQASASYLEGAVVTYGGQRYRAVKRQWRADKGQPWNPGRYVVGDVVAAWDPTQASHVYRCTLASGGGPIDNWGLGPSGTATSVDGMGNVWQYLGEWGTSGATQPFDGAAIADNGASYHDDGLMHWQYMSTDDTPAQALASFEDWRAKVMEPAIQAAVDAGLYVVVTDFDFGPAHHPLRHARMLDFWTRMARSRWANHPQVLFELWNESESIGSYDGGPGSWALQKPVIQETVDAIRGAGATNIIIVPTPFYSAWVAEATASPVIGTSIGYALHTYRSQWESYPSNRDQITQALASGQAIFVTEWGDDTNASDPALTWPTHTTTPPNLRQLFEPSEGATHPVAGWFAWALTQSWTPSLFTDSALQQPAPWGVAVRQWLADKRTDSQPQP